MTEGSDRARGLAENGASPVKRVGLAPDDLELLQALPPDRWAVNGVPRPEVAEDRERAVALVHQHLSDFLTPHGVRISVLGPGWSTDIDLHVTSLPPEERLRSLGWLPVDPLLRRLGIRGTRRWAIVEQGRVLTAVDLHVGHRGDPVEGILARCRRRGHVRVREVLELRELVRAGRQLPPDDRVVRTAARVEADIGGRLLAPWLRGTPLSAPARLSPLTGLSTPLSRLRRRRLVIAVTGVDGSGKSTLCRTLHQNLRRAGVPSGIVWTRPGMRLGGLEGVARIGKRLLRQGEAAGVGRVARGESTPLRSRRGLTGRLWALLVTQAFLRDVRRRHRAAQGVVLYDRHLADALVMLEVAYEGVDLRIPEALVRRLLPRAALTFWLEVPPELAVSRKPDDAFGDVFVRRQIDRYRIRLDDIRSLCRLDATRPAEDVAAEALKVVLGGR
jgi:thymidylate kinase